MAHSVWTGGSRYTGQAALPHKNIQKLMHRRMQSLFSIEWCSDLCIIYKELENKWYDILLMAISCNKYNDNRQLEKKKEVVEQIKNVYLMEYKELAKCMNKLGL